MEDKILNAIENKNLVEFEYDGEIRIVEIYCYGLTTKGNEAVRAFQVGGYSSSGTFGWKLYDLSKAENIIIRQEIFKIRNEYKKGDKSMIKIFSEL